MRLTPDQALAEWVVYQLRDEFDNALYVGMTGNLRGRMRSHRRRSDIWRLVRHVEVETFTDKEGAALRESNLIFELDPPFNSSGRRTREGEVGVGASGRTAKCVDCGAEVVAVESLAGAGHLLDVQYRFADGHGIANPGHVHRCPARRAIAS